MASAAHAVAEQTTSSRFSSEVGDQSVFTRVLERDFPRLPYRRRKGELKTVLHWGQRKLLMSEVEFLTLYSSPGDTVLYAGAAPGTHVDVLASMFPDLWFVLVDPAPFGCKRTPHVQVRQEYFTSQLAQEFKEKRVLFISDIRTANPSQQSEHEVEEYVIQDNAAQREWYDILRPKKAMLKFRLPYPDRVSGGTEYLRGKVFLPIWGTQTTTECRLVPDADDGDDEQGDPHTAAGEKEKEKEQEGGNGKWRPPLRVYDHLEYEQQLFWFNTVYRISTFPGAAASGGYLEGGDDRYDSASEAFVLRQYAERYPRLAADLVVPSPGRDREGDSNHTGAPLSEAAAPAPTPKTARAPEGDAGPPEHVRRLVRELSACISQWLPGGHTLATRPLNRLLAERTPDDPFCQAERPANGGRRPAVFRNPLHHPPSSRQMLAVAAAAAATDADAGDDRKRQRRTDDTAELPKRSRR